MTRRTRPLWQRLLLAAAFGPGLAAGCQQKMATQPSYRAVEACAFFADGTSARHPVAGTVARGHLRTDAALFAGRQMVGPDEGPGSAGAPPGADAGAAPLLAAEAAQFRGVVDEFPFDVTRDVLQQGRDRYMIYCVLCHDATGTGRGKIVERGYTRPPSYHIDRLRQAPVGHFFRVVTEGYGSMPSYAAQITPRDRWAIVAYVRALQLSQHFPVDKLPEDMRRDFDKSERVAVAEGAAP